ncbi:unknown [Proteobacteria bacterium CAG:495]|nr:unknown [Proteobacteria bacterium CAG:495]
MIMKMSDPLQKRELLGLILSDCYLDSQKLIYKIQKSFDKLLVDSKFDGIVNFHRENIADCFFGK